MYQVTKGTLTLVLDERNSTVRFEIMEWSNLLFSATTTGGVGYLQQSFCWSFPRSRSPLAESVSVEEIETDWGTVGGFSCFFN